MRLHDVMRDQRDEHLVLVIVSCVRSESPVRSALCVLAHQALFCLPGTNPGTVPTDQVCLVVLDHLEPQEVSHWCTLGLAMPMHPAILVLTDSRDRQMQTFHAGAYDCLCLGAEHAVATERLLANAFRGTVPRSSTSGPAVIPTTLGPLSLSLHTTGSLAGVPLDLPRVQLRLLQKLLESPRPVSVSELSRSAWPNEVVAAHTVHTQIALLKARLQDIGVDLKHIRRAGYAISSITRCEREPAASSSSPMQLTDFDQT